MSCLPLIPIVLKVALLVAAYGAGYISHHIYKKRNPVEILAEKILEHELEKSWKEADEESDNEAPKK